MKDGYYFVRGKPIDPDGKPNDWEIAMLRRGWWSLPGGAHIQVVEFARAAGIGPYIMGLTDQQLPEAYSRPANNNEALKVDQ